MASIKQTFPCVVLKEINTETTSRSDFSRDSEMAKWSETASAKEKGRDSPSTLSWPRM